MRKGEKSKFQRRDKRTVSEKIFWLAMAYFMMFGLSNTYYLLPLYLRELHISSPLLIGWVLSVFYGASTLSRPFLGGMVFRLGFKRLFSISSGFCALAAGLLILSRSALFPILFLRILMGVAFSLFIVGLTTYQTLEIPPEIRGSAFALVSAGGILPLVTLVPLGELLLKLDLPVLYACIPLLAAMGAFYAGSKLPDVQIKRQDFKGGKKNFLYPLSLREARILFLSATVFSLTDASILYVSDLATLKGLVASAFISTDAITALLIRILGRKILDKISRTRFAALCITFTAAALFLSTFVYSNLLFALCGFIYGIGMGLGFPLHLALIPDLSLREDQPQVAAIFWFLQGATFFLVPFLIGLFSVHFSPLWVFRIFVFAILISTPWIYWKWKNLNKRQWVQILTKNN